MFIKFGRLEKRLSREYGQVAIIVGFLLVAIVGILAYVIDEGSLYESRRYYQTVADSAALAGVQELPENPSGAIQAAIDYAAMHDVALSAGDINIESTLSSNDTLAVTVSNPNKQLFIAGIFGRYTTPVGATARALVGSPAEYLGVVPWGVAEADWQPGAWYTLKCGSPGQGGSGGEEGNFQALAINGTGASNYEDNIINGASIPLAVGTFILTETGNMAGPTIDGANIRIYEFENYIFNSFNEIVNSVSEGFVLKKNDSQFVICPIIPEFPTGRDEIEIVAFAPFVITEIVGSEIHGAFLNKALILYDGEIVGLDSSGIRVIRLTE